MKLLLTSVLICLKLSIGAQALWINKGTDVIFSEGLQVKVDGSFLNDSGSVFLSSATFYVNGSIENKGVFNHNGNLHLQNDWIQNGMFADGSEAVVVLDGDVQLLTGDSSSDFNRLVCVGTGNKKLERSISTGVLELNDRQVETDSFRLLVRENYPAAIIRTTGFVSSARSGMLQRAMVPGSEYLFPLGFGANFRPVIMTPVSSSTSGARYAEIDASTEGLQRTFTDSTICQTNPEFYHLLSNVAFGTQVRTVIESSFADQWTGISSRSTADPAIWEAAPSAIDIVVDSTYYSYVFQEQGNRAFLLYRSRPEPPVVSGALDLCAFTSAVVYSADFVSGSELIWNVAGGAVVSQQASEAIINWGQGPTGLLTVISSVQGGCSSLPSVVTIQLNPLPVADFTITPPVFPFEDELFSFESATPGFTGYFWEIEENLFLEGQEVSCVFPEAGTFNVTHIVIDSNQCRDTLTKQVDVIEGIKIPNVFSPNGDGFNDMLEFMSSGIDKLTLSIFDRWGNEVFSTNKTKFNWDGRISSGKLVPPGTYYYLLSAASSSMPYNKKGFITIIY